MTSFLRAAVFTACLLPAVAVAPSHAAQREPFEMVKDWEVERTVGDTSANPCLISKTYKDKEDNNAINGIVFALDGSNSALALVYQPWTWDKGESVKATLLAGKKILKKGVTWAGDAETLTAPFPDTIVPDLLSAKTITLRFDDGDAEFDISGFPQAYEALRRCDAAPAKVAAAPTPAPAPAPATPAPVAAAPVVATPPAAAAAAAPAVPPAARIQAYAFGLILQKAIKECDVSTNGKQRAGVDAKVAALQPEMAPIEAQLREGLKSDAPKCPTAQEEAKFQSTLAEYLDKSPEDFSAAMDKKSAEKAAENAAKPEAPKP
ncbi:hypothetical protein [Methylobacterium haplocladii]|uniref:Uncharacterized protein n=1 Tax=Methylobacterium haplocladii TaxID=1176176 RepID=A0A512IK58_9HYPH|nr:hypothetical protein [Methylobacterium haplocladii]GEO98089.1 hypothetical protein MHA02_04770 [Methylobacterium haplocladii]GLS59060.1 hypothetical protein GCM10007887_17260 [Methylobacterium haplocladii]